MILCENSLGHQGVLVVFLLEFELPRTINQFLDEGLKQGLAKRLVNLPGLFLLVLLYGGFDHQGHQVAASTLDKQQERSIQIQCIHLVLLTQA